MTASDPRPLNLDDLLDLIGARGNRNDVLLRVNRVLAGDRLSACQRLGLDAGLVYRAGVETFNSAADLHLGKAPGGAEGAQMAAIGDVFLAGLIIGSELK